MRKKKKTNEICTIYLLTNSINGKIYIGQTWRRKLSDRMGKNGVGYRECRHLYAAIRKYGAVSFYYAIIAQCNNQPVADDLEDYYMEKYDSRNPAIGYNLKRGGSAGKHSEETKAKISKTRQGKGAHTEEWKEANSKFMIERHKIQGHPMQGQHHTEEAKEAIGKASIGRKHPQASIEQRSLKRRFLEREEALIQAYQSGTTIKEICKMFNVKTSAIYRALDRHNIPRLNNFTKWTGKKHTIQTKQKMSVARQEYWDKKS